MQVRDLGKMQPASTAQGPCLHSKACWPVQVLLDKIQPDWDWSDDVAAAAEASSQGALAGQASRADAWRLHMVSLQAVRRIQQATVTAQSTHPSHSVKMTPFLDRQAMHQLVMSVATGLPALCALLP